MSDFHTPVRLGETGLEVSRLGIGSSFTGDPAFIEEAVEQGVNYLYWGSIRRPAFGRAIRHLARRNREGVVLTVQSYTRVAELLAPSIEIALLRAGVEYFDFLLLGMWSKPPGKRLIDAARRLVDQGKVRHLMLSTHNRASLEEHFRRFEAKQSPFDVFMLRYNAVNRGAEHDVFPHLPESPRPGIIAYTATRWGQLLDPKKMPAGVEPPRARDCYRFALSHPAVNMVLCAPADRAQMQEALCALRAGPLHADETARMHEIGDYLYRGGRPPIGQKIG